MLAGVQRHVVDQAHAEHAGGHEHAVHGIIIHGVSFLHVTVHDREVVGHRLRLGGQHIQSGLTQPRGVALAARVGRLHGPQRARKDGGAFQLLRRKVRVAAAQGQPGLRADGRHAHDLHRHVQVGDHAPDDRQLLPVLLAEVRPGGLHQVQQFQDDRGDTREVAGPRRAVQRLADAGEFHARAEASRVHVPRLRHKQQVRARLCGHAQVAVQVAGVAGQVLFRAELHGIDEHAEHHHGVLRAGGADQGGVARVQVAHRGDQAHRGMPPERGAEFGGRANDTRQARFLSHGDRPGPGTRPGGPAPRK